MKKKCYTKVGFHLDDLFIDTTTNGFESLQCQKNNIFDRINDFVSFKSTFRFLYNTMGMKTMSIKKLFNTGFTL